MSDRKASLRTPTPAEAAGKPAPVAQSKVAGGGDPPAPRPRIVSIDALRGFDMFWIVGGRELVLGLTAIAATPAVLDAVKLQTSHPAWEGFSAWDVIMPLFLFIVGAAIPFSIGRRLDEGQPLRKIYLKVCTRVIVLWILGMIAQGNLLKFQWSEVRLFSNTLQAIAVGYLVASVALIHLSRLGQVLLTVGVLLLYWAVMLFVPFGGFAAGTMEEHANLAIYIDQMLLGGFIVRDTTYAWILPSLGFVANVMLGVHAGQVLQSNRTPSRKALALGVLGLLCLLLGWLMAAEPVALVRARGLELPAWLDATFNTWWNIRFPIIKHLYTSSAVLWACGWSLLLLTAFYLLMDVAGLRAWSFPFIVIGSNALLAYMLVHPPYLKKMSDAYVEGLANLTRYPGEVKHVAAFALLWMILWWLYQKRSFWRI